MKKRIMVGMGLSITLSFVAIATETEKQLGIALLGILGIGLILLAILWLSFTIYALFTTRNIYNNLLESVEYTKEIEQKKYRAYFKFDGKELKDRIKEYDEFLSSGYDYSELCIGFLKEYKSYLSKNKYANVLEIEKEIRETSRA